MKKVEVSLDDKDEKTIKYIMAKIQGIKNPEEAILWSLERIREVIALSIINGDITTVFKELTTIETSYVITTKTSYDIESIFDTSPIKPEPRPQQYRTRVIEFRRSDKGDIRGRGKIYLRNFYKKS